MSIFGKLFGSSSANSQDSSVVYKEPEDDDAEYYYTFECPNCHEDMEYTGIDYDGGSLYTCSVCGNQAHENEGGVYFDIDPD